MADTLPDNLFALALIVYFLGMKHGFDADHLAMVDGLTRFNARANPRLARFCGVWFSFGHGVVVVLIALAINALALRWAVPDWLEFYGAWISIGFLLALGLMNLHAALNAEAGQPVQPVGLKARYLGRLANATHPGLMALIGALFAISFDTISQASLFALTATRFGGWEYALLLGGLFMLGMIVTDGINSYWISRLIRRADRIALLASRLMGFLIAGASLLVAGFGVLKLHVSSVGAWSDGKELYFGAAVTVFIAAGFLLILTANRGRTGLPADSSI